MDLSLAAAKIKLLILDVDGVLTDGRLFYGPDGAEFKVFHVRDGHGIKSWHEAGGRSAVITGRKSEIVRARAQELGITYVFQDRDDKAAAFNELLDDARITAEECCFVGDDSLDVPVMQQVGLAVAVADAHHTAKDAAHFVTQLRGGRGAVREVTDLLVSARE